jgi:hypothetical protein
MGGLNNKLFKSLAAHGIFRDFHKRVINSFVVFRFIQVSFAAPKVR